LPTAGGCANATQPKQKINPKQKPRQRIEEMIFNYKAIDECPEIKLNDINCL
jgi:hypothetical protein